MCCGFCICFVVKGESDNLFWQYGKQLTALVLGDVEATKQIKGAKSIRVGSGKKNGVLIDIECEKATSGKPE
jgi:hypothetical protein